MSYKKETIVEFYSNYYNGIHKHLGKGFDSKQIIKQIVEEESLFIEEFKNSIELDLDYINELSKHLARKNNEDTYLRYFKTAVTHYRWISSNPKCPICWSLNGQVFNYQPDRIKLAHQGCNCKIEAISYEEFERMRVEHVGHMERRDNSVKHLDDNAKDIDFTRMEKLIDKNTGKITIKYFNRRTGKPDTIGQCAKYVREAIEHGLKTKIQLPPPRPGNKASSAADYGPDIEKTGFDVIFADKNKIPSNYVMQKGDVVIFQSTDNHPDGHIAMFNGKYWVSDHIQNSPGAIKRGGNGFFANEDYAINGNFTIYRNPNWNDWEIDK